MKVNELQGGTQCTVNRKLCLHGGILWDERNAARFVVPG